MTTDFIVWGETYDISVAARDADGVALDLDATWQAALRVCRNTVGGELVADLALSISNGVASGSLDTGASGWSAGNYYYDVRLTDADGHDYWSEPVKLVLGNRNTPAS